MTVHSDGNSSARPDVHEIIERGVAMTNRVVENARAARRYWASWEACNDRLKEGSSMRDALRWHTPSGFGEIRDATATAAILATLRVSEHPQRNTQSACAISGILWNEAAVEVLTSHDWWDRTAIASAIVEYEITQQPKRIEWFRRHVPVGWGKGDVAPEESDLAVSRQSLRKLRDSSIAHSLDREWDAPTIKMIRESVALALEIAKQSSLIFLGHTSGLSEDFSVSTRRADQFWQCFEQGLVAQHERWKDEVLSSGHKDHKQ